MITQYGNPMFPQDAWASFSNDDKYRYKLGRIISEGRKSVLWIMLNPSTANAFILDPTLRKCREFSKRWGYNIMLVGNVFAYRSTDPKGLYKIKDPLGKENKKAIEEMALDYNNSECDIICGWGQEKIVDKYKKQINDMLLPFAMEKMLYCLGTNKNGSPKHPLYLPYTTKLRKFEL